MLMRSQVNKIKKLFSSLKNKKSHFYYLRNIYKFKLKYNRIKPCILMINNVF